MTTGRINQVAIGQTCINVRQRPPFGREQSSPGREMTSECAVGNRDCVPLTRTHGSERRPPSTHSPALVAERDRARRNQTEGLVIRESRPQEAGVSHPAQFGCYPLKGNCTSIDLLPSEGSLVSCYSRKDNPGQATSHFPHAGRHPVTGDGRIRTQSGQ